MKRGGQPHVLGKFVNAKKHGFEKVHLFLFFPTSGPLREFFGLCLPSILSFKITK